MYSIFVDTTTFTKGILHNFRRKLFPDLCKAKEFIGELSCKQYKRKRTDLLFVHVKLYKRYCNITENVRKHLVNFHIWLTCYG